MHWGRSEPALVGVEGFTISLSLLLEKAGAKLRPLPSNELQNLLGCICQSCYVLRLAKSPSARLAHDDGCAHFQLAGSASLTLANRSTEGLDNVQSFITADAVARLVGSPASFGAGARRSNFSG